MVPLTRERIDISKQVDKVLRGLGQPAPPLRLEDVRELLRLDLAYYSSSDDSKLRDLASRLRVAGRQVIERPMLLVEAVRKLELRGLYLPDRKRILVDSGLPSVKQRWTEAHEIAHSLIPWHQGLLMGDPISTLSPECREETEAEANFGASELLFLGGRFESEIKDRDLKMSTVRDLSKLFGNSLTATLWRVVELTFPDRPMVGAVTKKPSQLLGLSITENLEACRYLLRSRAFFERFGELSAEALLRLLQVYCRDKRGGPLGEATVRIRDRSGAPQLFHFETFWNSHDALTLGVWLRAEGVQVAVP